MVRKRTMRMESKSVSRMAAGFFSTTKRDKVDRATVPTATPKSPSGRFMIRYALLSQVRLFSARSETRKVLTKTLNRAPESPITTGAKKPIMRLNSGSRKFR